MKYLVLICFTIVFGTSSIISQKAYHIGVVAFYNLENLYDTIDDPLVDDQEFLPTSAKLYNSEKYQIKLNNLDHILSDIGTSESKDGAAIIGVAEIENKKVLKDLLSMPKLKNRGYKIIHYDSKDERGVDVGLLYNPKYYKILTSDKLYVNLSEEEGGRKSYTRDVLWTKGLFMGEELHVFVSHWPSRRGGEEASKARRCMAAKVIRNQIDSIYTLNPDAHIIVMGDLNDDPTSYSVVECLKAHWKTEKLTKGVLVNPFAKYFLDGIGTLAYQDAWNLFDQIIYSQSLTERPTMLTFHKAEIYRNPVLTNLTGAFKGYPFRTFVGDFFQGGYSDHFPTYIILKKEVKDNENPEIQPQSK